MPPLGAVTVGRVAGAVGCFVAFGAVAAWIVMVAVQDSRRARRESDGLLRFLNWRTWGVGIMATVLAVTLPIAILVSD